MQQGIETKTEGKSLTRSYLFKDKTKNMIVYEEQAPKGTRLVPSPYMAKETLIEQFGEYPIGFRVTYEPIFAPKTGQ